MEPKDHTMGRRDERMNVTGRLGATFQADRSSFCLQNCNCDILKAIAREEIFLVIPSLHLRNLILMRAIFQEK